MVLVRKNHREHSGHQEQRGYSPRLWFRGRADRGRDDGQILPIVLTAIIAVVAITMMMLQLGKAGLLRSSNQTAADSAALAAVKTLESKAMLSLSVADVQFPMLEDVLSSAKENAKEYAERNGAEFVSLEPVGGNPAFTRAVKVTVRIPEEDIKEVEEGLNEVSSSGGDVTIDAKGEGTKLVAYASTGFPRCYEYNDDVDGIEEEQPLDVTYVNCDGQVVAEYDFGDEPDLRDEIGPLIGPRLETEESASAMAGAAISPGTGKPITRDKIIKRARSWLTAWHDGGNVPYSMYGSLFEGYRRDCSAFVSYAWGLPGPGETTTTIPRYAHQISKSQLKQGDVMLNNEGAGGASHVVIFIKWANPQKTAYLGIEQRGGDGTVESVIPYGYFSEPNEYLPYRYNNVVEKAPSTPDNGGDKKK